MPIDRAVLNEVIFQRAANARRYTQDSPVMPDVWFEFGRLKHDKTLDLLLEPRHGRSPGELSRLLQEEVPTAEAFDRSALAALVGGVAFDESHVVAAMNLVGLVRVALPLTKWWYTHAGRLGDLSPKEIEQILAPDQPSKESGTPELSQEEAKRKVVDGVTEYGRWFLRIVGLLLFSQNGGDVPSLEQLPAPKDYSKVLAALLAGLPQPDGKKGRPDALWSVNRNRRASIAVWASGPTIKADAATRLFELSCEKLTWAILDTGVDATHPAFRERGKNGRLRKSAKASASRVTKTYDFTIIRDLLNSDGSELPEELDHIPRRRLAELRRRLGRGQAIAWDDLEGLIEVSHGSGYKLPEHAHGTHVAGILAADWRKDDAGYTEDEKYSLSGICPDIRLYDFRVLGKDGTGDEFSILAALQFIRFLNSRNRRQLIQGANLSLSVPHDVSNYACGRTPICEEVGRLHDSGVLVVAAAGNRGYAKYLEEDGDPTDTYRNISITDPGNADAALTVGATHRKRPHTFGVSYFSSRGPTGDGRIKPDLVAPGEKINGPTPGGAIGAMDGTSQAAPHVSGAAALIMSRHPEFIGAPRRIKEILCGTATDLGRERYFQGAGLVDVCRALQSI